MDISSATTIPQKPGAKLKRSRINLPRVFSQQSLPQVPSEAKQLALSPHQMPAYPLPMFMMPFYPSFGYPAMSPTSGQFYPRTRLNAAGGGHNQLLASDDPKERALEEWREEKLKLRIKEKRHEIDRLLSEEETALINEKQMIELKAKNRESEAAEHVARENKAAIVIQRRARGYLTRKRIPSLLENDFTLVSKTDVYLCEKYLREVISEEMIPDILVEICDLQHSSLSMTHVLLAHQIKYHMIEMVCTELICDGVPEWAHEVALSRTYDARGALDLTPDCDVSGAFVCNVLQSEMETVAEESINETIEEIILETKVSEAYDIIFSEAITDMELVNDCLLDSLCEYIFWDVLMEHEIDQEVKRNALRYQQAAGVAIYMKPSTAHQSATVTKILDYIIDWTMLTHLTNHIASHGESFLEWDAGDSLLDAILADVMMSRYLSLREITHHHEEFEPKIKTKKHE
ncbi:hypothetical protein BC830DRAFT_1102870 [Chytriomyces sp. MP71]|nr:hypothetical protein BC830DRAFT_1102870 [Chytriomyces sp. MP71]